jgi:hypothetical protein
VDQLKIEVAEALVLKPGDRVLLLIEQGAWTGDHIERAHEFLKGRFPDVQFTFMSGVERAVIKPAE